MSGTELNMNRPVGADIAVSSQDDVAQDDVAATQKYYASPVVDHLGRPVPVSEHMSPQETKVYYQHVYDKIEQSGFNPAYTTFVPVPPETLARQYREQEERAAARQGQSAGGSANLLPTGTVTTPLATSTPAPAAPEAAAPGTPAPAPEAAAPETAAPATPAPAPEAAAPAPAASAPAPAASAPAPAPAPAASAPAPAPVNQKQQDYNDLKAALGGDDTSDANQQAALEHARQKLGIAETPKPVEDLGQLLKELFAAATKDGGIDENEATAMANLIDKMAGKTGLSSGELMGLLKQFVGASQKDGTFSNQDLATFDKLLELLPGPSIGAAAQSGDAAASGGGNANAAAQNPSVFDVLAPGVFPGGLTQANMIRYLFSSFLSPDRISSLVKLTAEEGDQAQGTASSA